MKNDKENRKSGNKVSEKEVTDNRPEAEEESKTHKEQIDSRESEELDDEDFRRQFKRNMGCGG